jgi:hypothetical protein
MNSISGERTLADIKRIRQLFDVLFTVAEAVENLQPFEVAESFTYAGMEFV